jgi:hypothetical protein
VSSQRCRLRYTRAIKERREKSEKLALDNLSKVEAEKLGLANETVLDFHAQRTVQLLLEHGVCIPEALRSVHTRPSSVYWSLTNPFDAELFLQIGFRDISSWLDSSPNKRLMLPLDYLQWLDQHGLDTLYRPIRCCGKNRVVLSAHYTFYAIGFAFSEVAREYRTPDYSSVPEEWVQSLGVGLVRPDIADDCRCKCSAESCTPLIWMLKGMGSFFGPIPPLGDPTREAKRLMDRAGPLLGTILYFFGTHLETRHHVACLRFLTFEALELPHTCCEPYLVPSPPLSKEKVDEIEEEYAYELALLEELLNEFEPEINGISRDHGKGLAELKEFWRTTWASRIAKIRRRLSGDALSDEERRRGEGIGVVWHRPKNKPRVAERSNPYDRSDLEYWFY